MTTHVEKPRFLPPYVPLQEVLNFGMFVFPIVNLLLVFRIEVSLVITVEFVDELGEHRLQVFVNWCLVVSSFGPCGAFRRRSCLSLRLLNHV